MHLHSEIKPLESCSWRWLNTPWFHRLRRSNYQTLELMGNKIINLSLSTFLYEEGGYSGKKAQHSFIQHIRSSYPGHSCPWGQYMTFILDRLNYTKASPHPCLLYLRLSLYMWTEWTLELAYTSFSQQTLKNAFSEWSLKFWLKGLRNRDMFNFSLWKYLFI